MNNYNFVGIKGNDNLIIINNLKKEITLMKEKLKICQSQLISLTTKYQNCLHLNQKLKEKYSEFSKKFLKNHQEDEELYDIMDNLRKHLYEMSIMKNMTKEEREKEKDKREKKKKERQNKKKGKIGDIDLDELLNKRDKDLDDLFKKYNITKEEFQKRILNDTLKNKKDEKDDKDKKNTKKETDL